MYNSPSRRSNLIAYDIGLWSLSSWGCEAQSSICILQRVRRLWNIYTCPSLVIDPCIRFKVLPIPPTSWSFVEHIRSGWRCSYGVMARAFTRGSYVGVEYKYSYWSITSTSGSNVSCHCIWFNRCYRRAWDILVRLENVSGFVFQQSWSQECWLLVKVVDLFGYCRSLGRSLLLCLHHFFSSAKKAFQEIHSCGQCSRRYCHRYWCWWISGRVDPRASSPQRQKDQTGQCCFWNQRWWTQRWSS